MKFFLLIFLMMICAGCSAETSWEYVDDTAVQSVSVWQKQAYTIQMAVPTGAVLTEQSDSEKVYVLENGAYELSSHVFLASSLDSAVRYLSGLRAENVTVVQTTRFDLPEYHFAWCAQTEQGLRLCQADLVMDGSACYALVTSIHEDSGDTYDDVSRQAFSSFGLFFDEEV